MNITNFVLVVSAGCIISVAGYFFYNYLKPARTDNVINANPMTKGTLVIDYEHGFIATIVSVIRTNTGYHISYDNGDRIPYNDNHFRLLNTMDVMLGKRAIFQRGSVEDDDSPTNVKEYRKLRTEFLLDKARNNEVRLREQQLIKDTISKSAKEVKVNT